MIDKELTGDSRKQAISLEFGTIFQINDSSRMVLDRTMFRNVLYYLGEQWIDWLAESSAFGRRYEMDSTVPTPVSNIVRDNVRSMKALALNKKFVSRVWPNSLEQKDKDAAKTGEFVSQHFETRNDHEMADINELVAMWWQLTGNGFWRTFPDSSDGTYLVDKKGEVIGSTGDVRTECYIPFNVIVPSLGPFLRDKKYTAMKSLKEKEWVEDTFKLKLSGGEGQSDLVDYQKQLMTMVANVSPWKGRGLESGILEKDAQDLVLYQEIEWRPTKDYPKGQYWARAGGDVVIDDDKMPIPVGKDGSWEYTLTHVPYNYTPGAFWASGSVDDLISPQNTINEVDQALAINRKTVGKPFVLSPLGLIMKRLSQHGPGLLAIEYDNRTSPHQKPEVVRGTPYPHQILDERAINKQVAQDASGDPKNILRGETPYAGAPGIAIDMLREAAEQSHTPDIERFYRSYGQVKRKELLIAQDLYTENRILKIKGPGNEILVQKFKGADLHNNTDIRMELASGAATSNAGRTDMIMNLLQYGFFGNQAIPRDVQREILTRLGLSAFQESTNIHTERAEYENSVLTGDDIEELKKVSLPGPIDQLDDDGQPIVGEDGQTKQIALFPETHDEVFRHDRHDIHIEVLQKLVFSREFKALPEEKQMNVIGHLDMHTGAMKALVEEQDALRAQAEANAEGETGGQPAETELPGAGPIPFEE